MRHVGKSTLFNAVTRTRKAEVANEPFCTFDPNVGIVTILDVRPFVFHVRCVAVASRSTAAPARNVSGDRPDPQLPWARSRDVPSRGGTSSS